MDQGIECLKWIKQLNSRVNGCDSWSCQSLSSYLPSPITQDHLSNPSYCWPPRNIDTMSIDTKYSCSGSPDCHARLNRWLSSRFEHWSASSKGWKQSPIKILTRQDNPGFDQQAGGQSTDQLCYLDNGISTAGIPVASWTKPTLASSHPLRSHLPKFKVQSAKQMTFHFYKLPT